MDCYAIRNETDLSSICNKYKPTPSILTSTSSLSIASSTLSLADTTQKEISTTTQPNLDRSKLKEKDSTKILIWTFEYYLLIAFLCLFITICLLLMSVIIIMTRKIKNLKEEQDFVCTTLTNQEVVSALLGPISSSLTNTLQSRVQQVKPADSRSSIAVQAPSLESCVKIENIIASSTDSINKAPGYFSEPDIGALPLNDNVELNNTYTLGLSCPNIYPDINNTDNNIDFNYLFL